MSAKKTIAKCTVLIILIVILLLFAGLWFDYLGVIQAKTFFGPVYRFFGMESQNSESVAGLDDMVIYDLDDDVFEKKLEALELEKEALEKREADVIEKENANILIAQELEDKQKEFEEEKKTFNNRVKKYDDKKVRIEQLVSQLNGMPPQKAVDILVEMTGKDKQYVVDVLRGADEIAERDGTSSMVSYWMSLMPKDVSAELSRIFVVKPVTLD